jgi:hypothetical protein
MVKKRHNFSIFAKKGKSASGAASLIGLIGVFIVLYIFFLPADIRQDILEGNNTDNGDENGKDKITGRIILEENPGRLDLTNLRHCIGRECNHQITSFRLFMNTDSSELSNYNPFIVKNNILKKQFHTEMFELNSLEYTENVLLSFNTYFYKGILTILLNGNVIYEKQINTFNPEPIMLPKAFLSRSNRLEFQVSNVGWRFWDTNEIRFENMKITGDITDVSKQRSNNVFYLTDSEYYNLEKGVLRFSPDCVSGVGALQVVLNGRELYYSIPDCNALNVIAFPPAFLEKGENTIAFKTDRGSYFMDLIEIRTSLKEIIYPVYYFNLKDEDLKNLRENDLNLTANFEFVSHSTRGTLDPTEADSLLDQKYRLIMTVNGFSREIVSSERTHTRVISHEDIRKENNWIKLEPRGSSIEISNFKISLVTT